MRTDILSAARRLFISRGYRGLSMREIALAVGVSKPALYYHFKDKEELFLAILMETLEELKALLEEIHIRETACREQVREIIRAILMQPAEKRAMIRLGSQEVVHLSEPVRKTFSEAYQSQFIEKIQQILQMGMNAGELRSIEVSIAAWALLGIIYPYLYPREMNNEMPIEELIDTLTTIYYDGMAG